MTDNNEDIPELSAHTLAALQEFYREQTQRHKSISFVDAGYNSNITFDEDWQLSQFWYDDLTVQTIVTIVKKSVPAFSKIGLISCPTLYRPLKTTDKNYEINLFEYDQRFAIFGSDFIPYDYRSPLHVPRQYLNYYDLVIADPPFLSEECLTQVADTIKYICNKKMILCTGIIMSELAQSLLDMKLSCFKPSHKNNLANEFCCLSNFDIDSLL